ncbi:Zn-ribbon domain-containing OB-fold protein [Pseudonocardia sp. N23]|uniref:Zn-ribbon domain-containing OB-fold protein n=1 Tax=Pseudonocardia sp. N23 TaxID=1987376 RepID=UPI000BFCC170|nr:OB-fold domain-containing protein [Pseudonocardia sp. N23]
MDRVPLVDYLVLDDEPHLVAHECRGCGARYFDRRCACANCSGQEFRDVEVQRVGTLRTFTIVAFAAEGVKVPYVAGVIDCGGTAVRGNVVNVPPDPDQVRSGMKVRLTTVSVGVDPTGVEAVGFGFEPID